MRQETSIKILVFLNAISFIMMVTVNALANILPINGISTGEISDSYPNLFAPAGITFAIWGVIYLLLAGFVVYQGVLLKSGRMTDVIIRISSYFIISSLANAIWIFTWHYQMIPLSMVLMIVILISLITINAIIHSTKLSSREKLFVRLPFSIYFGWITVATIANATTLFVHWGWNGWGLSDQLWTILVLAVGLLIGAAVTLQYKDIAYGLVILWAYSGILIKHLSADGFAGSYPGIIIAVCISLVVVLITVTYAGTRHLLKMM